ncbi:hypothetical protein C0Q70_09634 [Pomacea canaliculata]|uniref:Secondary thiamine-phosphate synthase enzyme n=1 Tax=Pomacea canaliculata TaxID=400727 RepID=A0A2T7PAC8_POMCA|nr:hypothetical protein C0Q70_09634 [Pomacea canaliculata]
MSHKIEVSRPTTRQQRKQPARPPGAPSGNLEYGTASMATAGQTAWYQKEVTLSSKKRGCHLVTEEIVKKVPDIEQISVGLAHIHIKHTSASLALNENWDPDVRVDTEMMLNKIVPEGQNYRHSCEGPDDMPAHIKAALIGSSVTIPITDGKFNLGTWQGVWLL